MSVTVPIVVPLTWTVTPGIAPSPSVAEVTVPVKQKDNLNPFQKIVNLAVFIRMASSEAQ